VVGITAYSTYIPRHRLPRAVIASAWGSRAPQGMKTVINFDEDSLTMGHAAAWPLVRVHQPDALYFASSTAPHWQRSSASMISAFCDLSASTATTDFGGALRVGTMALRAALDAVRAGSSGVTVVVCADTRDGAPESNEEMIFGDGSAAVAVGKDRVIAEVIAQASRSDDFLDEWRRDLDSSVHSFSSKFSSTGGYESNAIAVGRAVLEQTSLAPEQIARAAIASLDGKAHLNVARALGIPAERIENSRLEDIGVTGAAMPVLLLAQALDCTKAGEVILCIGYGEGADGFLFRVTEEIRNIARPLLGPGKSACHSSYQIYRKLRDFLRANTTAPEISNVLWERQESQNVRLHGTFCSACGTLQFPITPICGRCHNKQGLAEKPLGRVGKVFTFNKDYLYDSPAQPTVMAVVDLDGGGRFLCQMTDMNESEVRIGMNVELVVRRMRGAASMHHYYWKCRPTD
jgi:hydroxymethylglutaryl-CoA synthase